MLRFNIDNYYLLDDKKLDSMLDDLAIGNKCKGEKILNDLISDVFSNQFSDNCNYKYVINDKIDLFKIKYYSNGDWTDDGYDDLNVDSFNGAIEAGLDLSNINLGANIKNEFKKVVDFSPLNIKLSHFYSNNIKNLKNNKLYKINTTNNGLNTYKPLTRDELVSIGFKFVDTYHSCEGMKDAEAGLF